MMLNSVFFALVMRHNKLGVKFSGCFFLFQMEHVSTFGRVPQQFVSLFLQFSPIYPIYPYITHTWYVNGDTNLSTAPNPQGDPHFPVDC